MSHRAAGPLLSILVPAYNFPVGLQRALDSMGDLLQSDEIEVVVSDDSSDAEAAAAVQQVVASFARVVYVRNDPPLGAAKNWNSLLQRAHGRYCLLLHHDESFETPDVLAEVLDRLGGLRPPDGLVMPCDLVSTSGRKRRNMPVSLASFVLRYFPGYLFHRNVVGAPSVLVLKRELYEPFDFRLRWLVDVELYARVLCRFRPRLEHLRGRGVLSQLAAPASITAAMGSSVREIRKAELAMLKADGALVGRGACLAASDAPVPRVLRVVETTAWVTFRVLYRGVQTLCGMKRR